MKHTIILLSYNRPMMIDEAIGSVVAQSHKDWELIIIDDNSDAEALAVIDSWDKRDSRIKVIYNKDVTPEMRVNTQRGQENINYILRNKLYTGELISYMSDDDFYMPNRLRVFDEYFTKCPSVIVCYSNQLVINEQTIECSLRGTGGRVDNVACKVDIGSLMHRTSIFEKIGIWEDFPDVYTKGEFPVVDALFFAKFTKAGISFDAINIALDCHRYHDKSYTLGMYKGTQDFTGKRE